MHKWALACIICGFVGVGYARGQVISLGASKDNTLYSSAGGGRSNGAGDHFFAGLTAQGAIRRGLIAFDVSAIPQGSIIHNATLTLYMSRTISAPEPVFVHRVLADWGEGASNANGEEGRGAPSQPGDATWLHTFWNTQFWTTPGGDFAPAPSASTSVGYDPGFYSWSSAQLTADVQAWVNGTLGNFGWLLMCDENFTTTAKRFDTKENPIPERRPALVIDYTPIPEPAAMSVLCGTALMLRRRR